MALGTSQSEGKFWSQWPRPKRWWRRVASTIYRMPDTGRFGLTPLQTHILICGYPRSGTTLLQMMLEHALPGARQFGREVRGYRAALFAWRNHEVMISKQPGDVMRLGQLHALYQNQDANLRAIIMIRDPRDVLTSSHVNRGDRQYFLEPENWQRYDEAMQQFATLPGVMVLRYEDLVADVTATQQRLEIFLGRSFDQPMGEFYTRQRADFETIALNGVRPVDRHSIGRWRQPEHKARHKEIFCALPHLPQRLVELGYEDDRRWVDEVSD